MASSALDGRTERAESLGPLLLRFRTERGLPQKQVAVAAGINNSTLSRLESGERGISREVLDRLCRVLELSSHEELEVLTAAGFLTEDAAEFLADEQLVQLGKLLNSPHVPEHDAETLRQYVELALRYAEARGLRAN
jgi:transcriptional regulator with XRE-family HTH domain